MKNRWYILSDLIAKTEGKKIAEIGVSSGENCMKLIEANLKLEEYYLVDIDFSVLHKDYLKQFDYIKFLNMSSQQASYIIPDNYLDLVFIDANHDYKFVKDDILHWMSKVKNGGILCGHDYMYKITTDTQVKKAVDEMFTNFNLEQDVLENGEIYIWWKQKI